MIPGAEPIELAADGPRVLLCHGFTSTPSSMALWAEGLHAAGCRVSVPRLPGHGTTWQEMNRTGWQDWYARVEQELVVLADEPGGERGVFVGGLSMGGALALRLAQRHPDLVAGLMLVNPAVRLKDPRLLALPLLRWVIPSMPGLISDIAKPGVQEIGYPRTPLHALSSLQRLLRLVDADLPSVTTPTIVFRSLHDHVVPLSSPQRVLDKLASTELEDVPLVESFHVATLDLEVDLLVERSAAFVNRLAESEPR